MHAPKAGENLTQRVQFAGGDRDVLVAAILSTALVKPGDEPQTAIRAFADVLKEMRSAGGTGHFLQAAPARSKA